MSSSFTSWYRVLGLLLGSALALTVAGRSEAANDGGLARVKPSDCRPRDADSTCATAVVGVTVPDLPTDHPDSMLYDGPLGGIPSSGYAYWGFDFVADQSGFPSPVRLDEYVNRSSSAVTITLTFNIPTDHPCGRGCLPGVQFQVDVGWYKIDPPYVVDGNKVSLTSTFKPGQGYGWLIGLWESSNPRLTVTVPKGSIATLKSVGLTSALAVADEIPLVVGVCTCADGSSGACSSGSHFSNGLLGPWYQTIDMYQRWGAFNDCGPGH